MACGGGKQKLQREKGKSMTEYYLAVDIGASSGRHILGHLEDGRMVLEEVYRFPNGMKETHGHLCLSLIHILKIEDMKQFTASLFLGEVFDSFLLKEAEIVTFNMFTIDGRVRHGYYSEEMCIRDRYTNRY